jgi:tetratricopeptide (TPR) repeat protein
MTEPTFADFYRRSAFQRVKAAARKAWKAGWKWLIGTAAATLAVFLGAYLTGLLNVFLPGPAQLACSAREWFREPAPGTYFTILVANLAGDEGGRQTRLVRDVFVGQRGLDARLTCRVVALGRDGGLSEAEAAAIDRGYRLLERWNADLLVWGEVKKADQELNLWFLNRGGSTLGAPSYSLTEKLTLPEGFSHDLGLQLEAVALAQVAPATEQAGTYLAEVLEPVAERLRRLLAAPPVEFDADQRGSLWFALGLATATLGEQKGDSAWLEEAVEAFRAALLEHTRERVPLDWGATQNNLGNALSRLGERESGTARLEEAVAAYRAALEEYTRERVPLDWAMTQNNLGNALSRLGARESGTARLEEAVEAYRAALEEWTRQRVPLDWARTQNNLGTALWALGERESGTARLEEAVQAFRVALEEWTRERVPLLWASTQNNLGLALWRLGERGSGTARLDEAVAAYRAALEERTRERVPLDWAGTQNNLGLALWALGERESETARLEEAVAAFRAALLEYTRERVPFLWALTQENVGIALATVGERSEDMQSLEEAVAAIRAALEVFELARAGYNVENAGRNLAWVEALLDERRKEAAAE